MSPDCADAEEEKAAQPTHMRSWLQEEAGSSIKQLAECGLNFVPPMYVRAPDERPSSLSILSHHPMPVIDLAPLLEHAAHAQSAARAHVIWELGCACEKWGFFQVINHGLQSEVIQGLRDAAQAFFNQPEDEKLRFHSLNFGAPVLYSTSVKAFSETVREWRDGLFFTRSPGICDGFQDAPEICKKEVLEYIRGAEVLAGHLYKAIFESLGLEEEYVRRELPWILNLLMAINYYPPCPDPTLTLGLTGHSDVCSLTILHPGDVIGLQVKHDGDWLPVIPAHPNALVVNLGDQIEILTNGKYKSMEHRVVTNEEKSRVSIACFFGPTQDTIVGPLSKLLHENDPPRYKPTCYKDYLQNFASNKLLSGRGTLNYTRI